MLDGCGGILWWGLLALVVFVAFRRLRAQVREEVGALRQRVEALETQIAGQDARSTAVERQERAEEEARERPRAEPPAPLPTPDAELPPEPASVSEPEPEPAEPETWEPPEPEPSPTPEPPAPQPPPPQTSPPPRPSRPSWSLADLEERLGARLPVWIGAAALALSGAFLVKYSLDQGWLGPPVRVGLAVVLGLTLLGAGEWMSRFPGTVAQGLSAAGVAVLFSSWLAAVQLYQLLSPPVGFGLMAATTALAVGLSLRRGPMVALIGLLGGLLTPYLIRLEEPRAWTLFGYLLLVEGGVLAVARRRGWTPIAIVSLGGGFLWTILWMAGLGVGEPVWPAMFLLATAVAGVLVTGVGGLRWGPGPWPDRQATLVARLAVAGSLVLLAVLTGVEGYSTTEWAFLGILAAGILVLGRLDPGFEFLPPVAAVAVAVLLTTWIPQLEAASFARFAATVSVFTALFGGGAFAALWGARRPEAWGWLSAAAGVAGPLLIYVGAESVDRALSWGIVFLTLAGLYAAGTAVLLRRRTHEREGSLEAVALAAAVLAILAAVLELEGRPLTLVLAVAVPVLVALDERWKISTLRGLTWLLVVGVFARRLFTEPILAGEVSQAWLLVDFGVPAAAFIAASWLLRRELDGRDNQSLARMLEGAALVFVLAFVFFFLHRLYLPETWISEPRELAHWGALVGIWLALARGLWEGASRTSLWSLEQGAKATTGLALAALAVGPLLAANPLWTGIEVGPHPVFNVLLWVYGLPLLLTAEIARHLRGRDQDEPLEAVLEGAAAFLAFVLPTLVVLFALEPGTGWSFPETLTEFGVLIVTWQILALILLALAGRWSRPVLRGAALPVASLAALTMVLGPMLAANPAWAKLWVGTWPVINVLLWAYGVPALLFAVLARSFRRQGMARVVYGLSYALSLVLLFLLVTLEVRQAFRGGFLTGGPASHAEQYAYSAAWIVLSTLLLVTGIARRVTPLRWAALAVMTVTVGKVFLYDTAHLSDLYRVVSYLGLGLSLMLLAWLYQRFVFR